jgi:hypothetical protein
MSFENFKKDFEKANKTDLEKRLNKEGKSNNVLAKRLTAWLKVFESLKKLASLLGYDIIFIKKLKK